MRLVSLKLKAFGCFAEEITINFDEFENGLYIITGDTGAGKTTINDAIMVALYGQASSGSKKNDRSFDSLYSHHVDPSTECLVELVFTHNGHEYKVERKLKPVKTQKNGKYEKRTQSASLYQDGNHLSEYKTPTAVNDKVSKFLNITVDQFRMICMLPQGQFKKFLEADSNDRSKILSEIFDTRPYVIYQTLIEKTYNKLDDRLRENGFAVIEEAVKNIELPEDLSGEDKARIHVGNNKLEEDLLAIIKGEEEACSASTLAYNKLNEEVEKKTTAMTKTVANNKDLEILKELEVSLSDYNEALPKMTSLKEKSKRVRSAHSIVIPTFRALDAAKTRLDNKKVYVEKLAEELKVHKANFQTAEEANKEASSHQEELKELYSRTETLKKQLEKYDAITSDKKTLEAEKVKLDGLSKKQEELASKHETIKAEIEALTSKKASLEPSKEELVIKENELNKAKNELAELEGKEGLLDRISKLIEDAKINSGKIVGISMRSDLTKKAYSKYLDIYNSFISGQAGILGDHLLEEVNKCGRANCPVCKAEYLLVDLESKTFARKEANTPSQEDVDKAKLEADEAADKFNKAQAEYDKNIALIASKKEALVGDFSKLYGSQVSWDQLKDSKTLEGLVGGFKKAVSEADAAYKVVNGRVEELKATEAKLNQSSEALTRASSELDQVKENAANLNLKIKGLETAITEAAKELKYEDKTQANEAYEASKTKYEKLDADIKAKRAAYDAAKTVNDQAQASYEAEFKQIAELTNQAKDLDEKAKESLKEYSFASLREASDLVDSLETDNVKVWLEATDKECEQFTINYNLCKENYKSLSEKTKGTEVVDISGLEEEITGLKVKRGELNQVVINLEHYIRNHRANYDKIVKANQFLADSRIAHDRLRRLRDLAVGSNDEGGKLSFERYVMGSVFKQVLDKANTRLTTMSGGRYEFIHILEGATKASQAGLEIEMDDLTTGISRETSSLSGGESFMASLSLALGLSDIVKEYAGGISLDTLFIDEGFGTLDEKVLDKAIDVLTDLAADSRQVGIISHVKKLEETISQQIRVEKTSKGSTIKVVS